VAVAPGFNFVITSVAEDFTLTGDGGLIPGSATLAGTANGGAFNCTRSTTGASTCPTSLALASVSSVLMTQDITTDAHATVTGIQDTFVQTAVPEPASLGILGGALLGFGIFNWARRRKSGGGFSNA